MAYPKQCVEASSLTNTVEAREVLSACQSTRLQQASDYQGQPIERGSTTNMVVIQYSIQARAWSNYRHHLSSIRLAPDVCHAHIRRSAQNKLYSTIAAEFNFCHANPGQDDATSRDKSTPFRLRGDSKDRPNPQRMI